MAKASTDLAAPSEAAYDLLQRAFDREIDAVAAYDSEEVQRAMAHSILSADDDAVVFGSASLPAWSELVGVPVELHGVHFNPSNVENGPGIYAVVDLTRLDTGERETRHVGGYRPVAQLLNLWRRSRYPFKGKLVEVAKAKSGQSAPLGIAQLDGKGD